MKENKLLKQIKTIVAKSRTLDAKGQDGAKHFAAEMSKLTKKYLK